MGILYEKVMIKYLEYIFIAYVCLIRFVSSFSSIVKAIYTLIFKMVFIAPFNAYFLYATFTADNLPFLFLSLPAYLSILFVAVGI
jgi:hypothetical protein